MSDDTTIADFDDAFDDWLAGASLARRAVTVFGKPHLMAEMQQIEAELDVLDRESDGEESMGDSRRAELEQRAREVHDEWVASKSTWIVQALSESAAKSVEDATGDEPKPKNPKSPTAEESKATSDWADERNLRLLAAAVVEIKFADGRVKQGITHEQVEAIKDRLGTAQILRIISEVNRATYEEPVVPAPFSRSSSQGDPR